VTLAYKIFGFKCDFFLWGYSKMKFTLSSEYCHAKASNFRRNADNRGRYVTKVIENVLKGRRML
jgi:hypothetical protein